MPGVDKKRLRQMASQVEVANILGRQNDVGTEAYQIQGIAGRHIGVPSPQGRDRRTKDLSVKWISEKNADSHDVGILAPQAGYSCVTFL